MPDDVACPLCGAVNDPADAFCLSCGADLDPATPPGPPATAESPVAAPIARKGVFLPVAVYGGLWLALAWLAVTAGEGSSPYENPAGAIGLFGSTGLAFVALWRWLKSIENDVRDDPDKPGLVWLLAIPPGVELARFLDAANVTRILGGGLCLLRGMLRKWEQHPEASELLFWVCGCLVLAYVVVGIWLCVALTRGWRSGWYVQIPVMLLWLTRKNLVDRLAGLYLLALWFRRETRAWFGLR